MILTELFDSPVRFFGTSEGSHHWATNFKVDGRNITVSIEYAHEPRTFEIVFGDHEGNLETTNYGDEFKVFSGVIKAIKEFLRSSTGKSTKKLIFTGTPSRSGDARISLYQKLVNRFAKQLGFKAKTTVIDDGMTKFELIKG